jgi:Zn-dependent protease with chaperone function
MIVLDGDWYDGRTSARIAAVLEMDGGGRLRIRRADTGETLLEAPVWEARVSDRLENTPRTLTFGTGAVFETEANDAVDRLLARTGRRRRARWVHALETKGRHVLVSAVMVVLIGAALVRYGIPAAAQLLAAVLPGAVYETADRQTLALLDRALLAPSALPPEVRDRVRRHLRPVADDHPDLGLTLLFRRGGRLGPNALALPGGTIVFTDEMVTLAAHDDELLAVMAHEAGHVVHRHAMRRMVQDSLLSFALMALTGDASGAAELFLGLPVLLTELAYSREFERQADRFALDYLGRRQVPAARLADLLERIDQRRRDQVRGQGGGWSGYLSTHPSTPERIQALRSSGP